MLTTNPLASRQVAAVLAERIAAGTYLPGARLPAERELAAEFAADRSAVRAALSELTRTGQIVRQPGCRPRVSAARAATSRPRFEGRTQAIAVILPQHSADHGSREIVRGITHVLRSQESVYRPLIFDTNLQTVPRGVLEKEACTAVLQERLAGAIVWPTLEEGSLDNWRSVQAAGCPVVFVDRFDDTFLCDFAGVDNYDAAKDAVRFLLKQGHTRIAHLTLDQQVSSTEQRIAGYRDALAEAGLPSPSVWTWHLPPDSLPEGVDAFAAHLRTLDPPVTAVFAANDQIAHTLIACLEAAGISVPADLSVLGFDDDDQYSVRPALLTTVRQPFERIGRRAAELLLRRLGPQPPSAFQTLTRLSPPEVASRLASGDQATPRT